MQAGVYRMNIDYVGNVIHARFSSVVHLGVTYTNMLVATQWPLKRAPRLPGSVWYGDLEAHWSYLAVMGHGPNHLCNQIALWCLD